MKRSLLKLLALAAVAGWLLAGCAGGYVLDNSVQSFSSLPALPSSATYRFERLPSQQAPGQVELETMADAALHQAGLKRDDANPTYSVQVSGRIQPTLSPWADPWDRWGGAADGPWGCAITASGSDSAGRSAARSRPGTTVRWR
jgi:hypothetical protein